MANRNPVNLLSFDRAIKQANALGGKKHLLLGNGFGIGAHSLFKYGTLFQQAKDIGLPMRVLDLFIRNGTCNFEEVLRHLDEGAWLADHYRLKQTLKALDMRADYNLLKRALVETISRVHPGLPNDVGENKLMACASFIGQFDHIYTVNYDFLLYWSSLVSGQFPFEDAFGREADTDDKYCVFLPTGSSKKQLYFLHGALHLYVEDGDVKKRVWNTTGIPLMDQVSEALESKRYPLVVSEGKALDKKRHIEASSYLSYCWRKFENIQGSLFIYGHSLSHQDQHLLDAIANNTTLANVFVGIYGDLRSTKNQQLNERVYNIVKERVSVLASGKLGRKIKKEKLTVSLFNSKTAPVWGNNSNT